jgi:hypothetical protein
MKSSPSCVKLWAVARLNQTRDLNSSPEERHPMRPPRCTLALAIGLCLGVALGVEPAAPRLQTSSSSASTAEPSANTQLARDPVLLGFQHACELGEQEACVEVALRIQRADARNTPHALDMLERSCKRASGLACYHYARALAGLAGWPVVVNKYQAHLFFSEGCIQEHADSCTLTAHTLFYGELVHQRLEAASSIAHRACHRGDPDGCLLRTLAEAMIAKNSPPPKPARCGNRPVNPSSQALDDLELACSHGLVSACELRASREWTPVQEGELIQAVADLLCAQGDLSACQLRFDEPIIGRGHRDPFAAPPADLLRAKE